ncbi:DUF2218 domain-containing protein [Rhizobium sp. DKSPLA3]|uniref:DUF2218 domain-containing protein n=1 Tax=Rhizobium quercicola TaxID=2901226 RepID=A0A9X1T2Q4_9HYPH|nr:DUF2218 domain-containing protein [Rhizobium quercicola]MCD7111324.1 DUF2218 domain-containing protein [Rhizobium quercicola]
MLEATSRFETNEGQKYLVQLCKHFAHKIEVEHAGDRGELRFSCGTGFLLASAEGLSIRVRSPDDRSLGETKAVIESHLLRFAFREPSGPLLWTPAA